MDRCFTATHLTRTHLQWASGILNIRRKDPQDGFGDDSSRKRIRNHRSRPFLFLQRWLFARQASSMLPPSYALSSVKHGDIVLKKEQREAIKLIGTSYSFALRACSSLLDCRGPCSVSSVPHRRRAANSMRGTRHLYTLKNVKSVFLARIFIPFKRSEFTKSFTVSSRTQDAHAQTVYTRPRFPPTTRPGYEARLAKFNSYIKLSTGISGHTPKNSIAGVLARGG